MVRIWEEQVGPMPHVYTLIAAFNAVFYLSDKILRSGHALGYVQHGGCEWNALVLKPAIMY